jgi:hypothetical protein
MSKVAYGPLSPVHKVECLWCSNAATHEASLAGGNLTAKNQCCDDSDCMRKSREMCETTVGSEWNPAT